MQKLATVLKGPDAPETAVHDLPKATGRAQRRPEDCQRAADKAHQATEGCQKAMQASVMGFVLDMAKDAQGFASGEVVQQQLQIMSACFDGLCHEVHTFQAAAAAADYLHSITMCLSCLICHILHVILDLCCLLFLHLLYRSACHLH